ncbi:MAG TPA: DUF58 domain-containing protein [Fibrobacteria bacterium]|nr:DUF58 domain-containing protein [Fibrobacteria bacterium]HOX52066.1 DUF58 domain-containing protein [Fibrobacteria bacterium]
MIPGHRLLWGLAIWVAIGGVLEWTSFHAEPWRWASLAVLLWILQDFLRAHRNPRLEMERIQTAGWIHGRESEVVVKVFHREGRPVHLEVFDHHPPHWEMQGHPAKGHLREGQALSSTERLRPPLRGDHEFAGVEVLVDSPSRLWRRRLMLGKPESVRVFPELALLRGSHLPDSASRIQRSGVHRKRRRGEGTEFHQLREYRQGDPLRGIDWKATARQGRPISREYQEERDQQVIILLDAGRRMVRRDGDKSHFDHCLEAAMRLAWTGIQEGDAVGLLCFSDRVRRFIPPTKGRAGLDRLLEGTYDLQPDSSPPDFLVATEELRSRVRRRALVVLLTLLEEEDSSTLHAALSLVRTRHLVLCASLRETALDLALEEEPKDFPSARTQASLLNMVEERRESIRRLGLPSRLLLEASPSNLHEHLVARYLAIKGSGRL